MYRLAASTALNTRPVTAAVRTSRSALTSPPDLRITRLLIATTALSLLGPTRAMSASANGQCANPPGEVPSSIQSVATDILKMYTTKSAEEQGAIVHKHYRPDAHFVDPLMDVATPKEIHLAFYSLIKLFASVEVEQKSLTWNEQPVLPSSIKAEEVQQVVLNNRQVYHLSKRTIDLDVNTYLTVDPKSGQIVRHEDRWNNSRFGMPSLLKKPNGLFTSGLLKLFGWGRAVDEAAAKATGAQ